MNSIHAEPTIKPLSAKVNHSSAPLLVDRRTQSSTKSNGESTPVVPPRGKKSHKKSQAPPPPEIAVNTAKRSESESSSDSNMSTDSNNLKVRKRDSDRDRRRGRVGSDLAIQLEAYINSQEHTYDEVNSSKVIKKANAPPCHLDDNAVAKLEEFAQGRRIDILDILREEGERLGMGLNIQHTKGPNSVIQGVFVKNVNPGGAADRAEGATEGLCAGDELLAVNGDILREKTYSETVKLLSDLPLNVQVVVARERDYDDVDSTDKWLTRNAENGLQQVKLNENQLWMKIEKNGLQHVSPHTSMKNLDQETRYLWQMVESLPTMRDSYNPEGSQSSLEGTKNGPIYASPGELTQSEEEIVRSQETSSLNTTASENSLPRKIGSPLPEVPVSDRDEGSLTSPNFSVDMSDNEEDLDDLLMLETEVLSDTESYDEEEHRYSMPLPKSEGVVPDQGEQFESTPSPEVEEETIVPEEKNHVYATMGPFQDEDEEVDMTTGERVYDTPPEYWQENKGDPEMLHLTDPPITDIDDLISDNEEGDESEITKPPPIEPKKDDFMEALKMLTDDDTPVVQENRDYETMSMSGDEDEQDSEMPEEELREITSSPEKDFKNLDIDEDFASTPMIPALTPPTDSSSFDFGLPDSKNSTLEHSISGTPMLPPLPFDSSPEMTPPPTFTTPPPLPATLPPPLRSPSTRSINEPPVMKILVEDTESCPEGYTAITPVDSGQTFAAPPINEPLYVDPDAAQTDGENPSLGNTVDNIFQAALEVPTSPDEVDGVVRRPRPPSLLPLVRPPTAFRDDSSCGSSPEKSFEFTPPPQFMDNSANLETKSLSGESSSSLDISDTSDMDSDDEPPIVSPLTVPPNFNDFSTIHGPEEELEKRRLNKSFSTGSTDLDNKQLLRADTFEFSSSSDDDDELNLSVQTARRNDVSDADTSRTSIENVPVSEPMIQAKTVSPVLTEKILSEQLLKSDSSGSELDPTSPRLPPDGHEFPETSTCQTVAFVKRAESPNGKDVITPSKKPASPDGSAQAALVQAVQNSALSRPKNFDKPILPKKPLLPGAPTTAVPGQKPPTSPKPSPRSLTFGSETLSPRKSPPARIRGVDMSPPGSFAERAAKFGPVLKRNTPPISPRSTPPISPRNTPPMSPVSPWEGKKPGSPFSRSPPRLVSPTPKSGPESPKSLSTEESKQIPVVEDVIAATQVKEEKCAPPLLPEKLETTNSTTESSDSKKSPNSKEVSPQISPRSERLKSPDSKSSVPPLKMGASPLRPSILETNRSSSPSPKLKGLSVPKKLSSTTSTSSPSPTGMPKVGVGLGKAPPVLLPMKTSPASSQQSSSLSKPKQLNVKRFSWGTKSSSDEATSPSTTPSVESPKSPKPKAMMPLRRLHGGHHNPLKTLNNELNKAESILKPDTPEVITVNRVGESQISPSINKSMDLPKFNRNDRPDSGIGTLEKDATTPLSQSPPSSKPVLPPKPPSSPIPNEEEEDMPPALPVKSNQRLSPEINEEAPPPLPSSAPPPLPTSTPPEMEQTKAATLNSAPPSNDDDEDDNNDEAPALPSVPPPTLDASPSSAADVSVSTPDPEEGVLEITVRKSIDFSFEFVLVY